MWCVRGVEGQGVVCEEGRGARYGVWGVEGQGVVCEEGRGARYGV